jgi:hypothetical protein
MYVMQRPVSLKLEPLSLLRAPGSAPIPISLAIILWLYRVDLMSLNIKALGIQDTKRNLMVYSDGKLDIEIQTQVLSLREVVISAEKSANVRNVQMGVEKLSISSIKQVPVAFGEADIVKVMLTLPGCEVCGRGK